MFIAGESVKIITILQDPDTGENVQGDSVTVQVQNSNGETVLAETAMTYNSNYQRYEYCWNTSGLSSGTYTIIRKAVYNECTAIEKKEIVLY